MNDKALEDVSAFLDGNLPEGQAGDIVAKATADPELRAAWSRYHLMGDALRGSLPDRIDPGFAERVAALIDKEPAILAPRPPRQRAMLKPLAGLAVAASVATVAILGVQRMQTAQTPAPAPTSLAQTQITQPAAPPTTPVVYKTDAQSAAMNRLLNRYLVNHNELRANMPMQGMLPYARVVGYEQPAQR